MILNPALLQMVYLELLCQVLVSGKTGRGLEILKTKSDKGRGCKADVSVNLFLNDNLLLSFYLFVTHNYFRNNSLQLFSLKLHQRKIDQQNYRSSYRRCSVKKGKFCKFHKKTPVLESLFNELATLLKRYSNTGFFL